MFRSLSEMLDKAWGTSGLNEVSNVIIVVRGSMSILWSFSPVHLIKPFGGFRCCLVFVKEHA
jgi:hypothetical protein